jgi:hypothetical protein
MVKSSTTRFWWIAAALVLVEALWLFGHSPRKKGEWFGDLNKNVNVMARSNGWVEVGERAWQLPDNPKPAVSDQSSQVTESTGDDPLAEPQDILKTNSVPERFSILTNVARADQNSNTLIAIWRSPDSTPEERARALTKCLPQDTTVAKARSLLGNGGPLSHYFGILVSRPGEGVDDWVLEYKTPQGPVSLVFVKKPGSSNEVWFDRAFPGSY